ncbi:MAG: Asp-tRNA(Asn)/Glu-tRNA(Gln) amidotransferase subunit GatC [Deltaproteobacteria bacterium]|nr:Asp-tRNA(Asn)/Glu-tRNA(Gln) amidotransferase subunit GatC [Deltaproteobacteria bacterium]
MAPETKQLIEHAAQLARLGLDATALDRYAAQCATILEFVEQLNAVPTHDVPPMSDQRADGTPLRPDVIHTCTQAEAILAQAPAQDGRYFAVPKVIE